MRLLACLLALGITACQHADSAEQSAKITAQARPAPVKTAPAPAPGLAPPAPLATAPEEHHCGCGMDMGACTECGGGECGGEAPHLVAPANATWTTLHVTGMHCGGCAHRIERALAGVSGVLGVKADFASARVEVATASGVDARRLVSSTIDKLGYHVE